MNNTDWIRRMRIKQGLKGFQLAERMNVSAARVSVMEKDEARGAVTLKMMEKAAKAMGCRFEYRIIARTCEAEDAGETNSSQNGRRVTKPRYRVVAE